MDRDLDPETRLAALRHPASGPKGSVHYAQHQLAVAAKAYVAAMAAHGNPGAALLPPPPGRDQWPRRHPARRIVGWPAVTGPGSEDWIATDGRWWRLQFDAGRPADAYPLGSPIVVTADLAPYLQALERLQRNLVQP